jgi:broad specificity phosphatase PhoE
MRTLILVKHSLPEIVPTAPASTWRLGDEGRRRCAVLAGRLATWQPATIIASEEPKAGETAALVAARLQLPWATAPGLHEHERDTVGFLDAEAWHAAVAAFFARPARLVLGSETAHQARHRFSGALDEVLSQHQQGTLVIVAHGTVISLYVAHQAGGDPFALWQRLGLPSFVVLTLPGHELVSVVEAV